MGRLLTLSEELHYVGEPLNVTTRPSWLADPARHWYQYLPSEDALWDQVSRASNLKFPLIAGLSHASSFRLAASAAKKWTIAAAARARGERALVKDPFMVFNAPEFERRLGGKVVFTVRHPAAFASSLIRMNWPFDFRELTDQNELMQGPLARWRDQLAVAVESDMTILEQACLLWRVVNGAIHDMVDETSERHLIVHEHFASQVEVQLPRLYEALGLEWSRSVESKMSELTRSARSADVNQSEVTALDRDSRKTAEIWRHRLSASEVKLAEKLASPEFELFYERD